MKRRLKIGVLLLALTLGCSEVGLRIAGAIDFPLYQVDAEIGYVPAPNQHGKFLRKNHWEVNDRNMGVAENWSTSYGQNLLLVGDSIVWGGNSIDQPDKEASQLGARLLNWKVWPIAAGSWSTENPWAWFRRNPDVMQKIDRIVWIINSGDFAPTTQWNSEITHPRSNPPSATWFVAEKYLLPKLGFKFNAEEGTGQNNSVDEKIAEDFAIKTSALKCQLLIIIYPEKSQLSVESPSREKLILFQGLATKYLDSKTQIIKLIDESSWNEKCYRDSIHPNAYGNGILAEIIANRINLK